ncbi:glycoside hydrolase family 78 protein [Niabella terrae]
MRVAFLNKPLGIDDSLPPFSWKLVARRPDDYGQAQTAYQVLVASSPKLLVAGRADLWDSHWVSSTATSHIRYSGQPLQSDRTYYWKVRVRDEKGRSSDWSETTRFSTGFLDPAAWRADWIGDDQVYDPTQKDCNIRDPWFRKSFQLEQQPDRAMFYIASIGYHELYVNGQRVGHQVLAPAVTDHTKRARYFTYDIRPYLKQGANTLGVWLGTSWSIFAPYIVSNQRPLRPLFTAWCGFYTAGNSVPFMKLSSDVSWMTKPSPNQLLGSWDFAKMGGELWDDRQADSCWNQGNCQHPGWQQAQSYRIPLGLSAQMVEGNEKVTEIRPRKIERLANGDYRVDFGTNFAGWTQVRLRGQPGARIDLLFSERAQETMTFDMRSAFIIGPAGEGVFRNRFNYSSGRWMTIRGLDAAPELKDITGWMIRTAYSNQTSFSSSDTLINWIEDRVRWTFENLSLGGYVVDCPQRERMGYGGDAHATSETGMYHYGLEAFYNKWMQDWRDVQGTEPMVGNMRDTGYARRAVTSGRIMNNGILPHTAPTYWGGGGPAWGGIVVSLPWFIYQHYGNRRILEDNYTLITNWLGFLETHVEGDILQRFGGKWDFLGDWLWPNATAEGMNNDQPETLCLNNSYRVFNLRTAVKIATVLGRTADARRWQQQADAASLAIHKRFYDHQKKIYADGSMANLAAALLAGVVPADQQAAVEAALEHEILVHRKGHIHAGITGGALLFLWLRQQNRNDLIYSMLSQKGYPGWGFMKANDATTIWEMWEKDLPGHSLLHSSYLYPGAWMIDGLAGIKKTAPGFTSFDIRPPAATATDLQWVRTSFDAPSGRIQLHWSRASGQLALALRVPPNTSARLVVPAADAFTGAAAMRGVQQVDQRDGMFIYQLEPGQYRFGKIEPL